MKRLIKALKAVSDPSRFKILKLLQQKSWCVCEITRVLGLAQPSVSRHLKQLEEAGLVVATRSGQRMDYALAEPEEAEVAELLQLVSRWAEDDPEVVRLRAEIVESC